MRSCEVGIIELETGEREGTMRQEQLCRSRRTTAIGEGAGLPTVAQCLAAVLFGEAVVLCGCVLKRWWMLAGCTRA